MRVLVAYDGSEAANASLRELIRAGLPSEGDALISVTDLWLPSSLGGLKRDVSSRWILAAEISSFAPASRTVEEQRALSIDATKRLRSLFPAWDVKVMGSSELGWPPSELLLKAASWNADLIVVGSDSPITQSGLKTLDATCRVVADAACSVRVARSTTVAANFPVRLVVGLDTSPAAWRVAQSIASRAWPKGSACRIVIAECDENARQLRLADRSQEHVVRRAVGMLKAAGLDVSTQMMEVELHLALVEEARCWNADSIFVGPHASRGTIAQSQLDDTTSLLIATSPCSVEVARSSRPATSNVLLPVGSNALISSTAGVG